MIFKVWKAGTGTLVITIPKWMREDMKLSKGEYIEIPYEYMKKARL